MLGPAIVEIVAVDRGDDDMGEAEPGERVGDSFGLMRIEAVGPPGRDVAERAGARADAAEDHHGHMLLFPALADIRARCLLADGVELLRTDELAGLVVLARHRRLDADPCRLALDRIVRLMRLLGMTRLLDRHDA